MWRTGSLEIRTGRSQRRFRRRAIQDRARQAQIRSEILRRLVSDCLSVDSNHLAASSNTIARPIAQHVLATGEAVQGRIARRS